MPESTEPVLHYQQANGLRLAYFERHPELRGVTPTLLFVHATGFHGRVWDQVISRLPDCHSIALESRGHGRSEKVKIPHWGHVVDDVREFIRALNLTNVLAIGHSMGAHALIGAAPDVQERLLRIVAIDPVIAAEADYEDILVDVSVSHEHPNARRRPVFDSVEDMAERLKTKGSYGKFDPAAFMDYCRHGLLQGEDGAWHLACPPDIEASVYMTSRTNRAIYDAVRAIQVPVLILRAKLPGVMGEVIDFSSSPTSPTLVREFPNAREHFFSDRTHFLPMEIPGIVAHMINGELSAAVAEIS